MSGEKMFLLNQCWVMTLLQEGRYVCVCFPETSLSLRNRWWSLTPIKWPFIIRRGEKDCERSSKFAPRTSGRAALLSSCFYSPGRDEDVPLWWCPVRRASRTNLTQPLVNIMTENRPQSNENVLRNSFLYFICICFVYEHLCSYPRSSFQHKRDSPHPASSNQPAVKATKQVAGYWLNNVDFLIFFFSSNPKRVWIKKMGTAYFGVPPPLSSSDGLDHLSEQVQPSAPLSPPRIFQKSSEGVWEEDGWGISWDRTRFQEQVIQRWSRTLNEQPHPELLGPASLWTGIFYSSLFYITVCQVYWSVQPFSFWNGAFVKEINDARCSGDTGRKLRHISAFY